jgi:hypothetical protein
VDAVELAPGHGQVAGGGGATGEHHGVELRAQLVGRDVHADLDAGAELGALCGHLLDPAIEVALLHLELGDAVAEETADPVGPLEHHDVVARPRELLRGSQARGTGADHGDALAGLHRRRHRHDPALVPGPVDDRHLDLLDRDGVLVDAEHAGPFARRRAQPARELGEVVGGVEPVDRVAPAVAVDEVVPVRDQVPERAAVVAEGDATVHAARGLHLQLGVGERLVHLLPVAEADGHGAPRRRGPAVLEEPLDVTHRSAASYPCAAAMMASSTFWPVSSAMRAASSTRL